MRRFVLLPVLVVAAFVATTSAAGASTPLPARSASVATPHTGGVGVRLLDVPTVAREDPRARQYIVDHLVPGSITHRRIEVSNTTRNPLHIALYSAAAGINNGSFLGAEGHTPNALSTWTTLSQDGLDSAPSTTTTVMVTIAVPADAAPGEQYATVWAEVRAPGDSGVILVNRVGIRMYVSVGPGNAPAPDFTVSSLTAQRAPDGHPIVTADLTNTGGRALDMSGTLSLSGGPGSLNAGPFPAQLGTTLAPGQSAAVAVSLDQQLPDGPWTAALTLSSGLLEKKVEASILFPAQPGTATPVSVHENSGVHLALIIGALVLAMLLVAAVVFVLRRRHRQPPPAHPVA